MQIFYAYEKGDGVYLKHSYDAGNSFHGEYHTGTTGCFLPKVFARKFDDGFGEKTRVDVIYYTAHHAPGWSIYSTQKAPLPLGVSIMHWEDFENASPTVNVISAVTAHQATANEVELTFVPPWGFDAVFDGNQVALVLQKTKLTVEKCLVDKMEGIVWENRLPFEDIGAVPNLEVEAGEAQGMTGPVDEPRLGDMHQLGLLIIE